MDRGGDTDTKVPGMRFKWPCGDQTFLARGGTRLTLLSKNVMRVGAEKEQKFVVETM